MWVGKYLAVGNSSYLQLEKETTEGYHPSVGGHNGR